MELRLILSFTDSINTEHLPCTRYFSRNCAEAATKTKSYPLRAHNLKQKMENNTYRCQMVMTAGETKQRQERGVECWAGKVVWSLPGAAR